jgi:uncharacterized sulfatase
MFWNHILNKSYIKYLFRQAMAQRMQNSVYSTRYLAPMMALLIVSCSNEGETVAENVQNPQPNVVWIVSEDNSMHYLGHFFEGGAEAPNIESLAAAGLTFRHAFSNAPVCSTARTTLATSKYAPRVGAQHHRNYRKAGMPAGARLFHEYLQDAGYYVTNHTKTDYNVDVGETWDDTTSSASWRNRPDTGQAFFHFVSLSQSHEGSMHFGREALESTATSHDPDEVVVAEYLPDTPLVRYTHATYLDRMKEIDRQVAVIVADLEQDGLLEDTFIFYFGDHGGVLPRSKGFAYDSGLHVPLVVRVPENFRHLVDAERGADVTGFVEFTDFGPTVLALAGIEVPEDVDGKPFLGANVDMDSVNARDESLGYADRFDEKYDFVRTLRKGRYRYNRNYQPYLPDGLMNNYRYEMLAYQEWRELFDSGSLNDTQGQFFKARPAETLYDSEADPHNVHNLAGDPAYAEILDDLRGRLQVRLRELPDLSFYPESYLVEQGAFADPVAFGQARREEIAKLMETADLALLGYSEARPKLIEALASDNPMIRMWAVTAATSFGNAARDLRQVISVMAADDAEQVRIRVADFLGVTHSANPQPLLATVMNGTDNPAVAMEALNSAVFFNDFSGGRYPADVELLRPAQSRYAARRMKYLQIGVRELE